MHARSVAVHFQPDRIDEAARIMREVADTLRGHDGFHEVTLLADRASGRGQIVSLWLSEAERAASETTVYREAMQRLVATFAAPPERRNMEVLVHEQRGIA